jgi:hypothetical protein
LFEIMIKGPKEFLRILKGVAGIRNCVNVDFSPRGIEIIAIDEGRNGCFKLSLTSDDFDAFKINTELCRLGLDLDDISKLLSQVTDKDVLILKYDENIPTKFGFIVKKEKNQQIITTSIEIVEDMKVRFEFLEKLSYPTTGFIDLSDLNYAIKMSDKIGSFMNIASGPNGLTLSAESSRTTWEQNFPENLNRSGALDMSQNKYSIFYLKKLVAMANPKKAIVNLSMERSAPIRCSVQLLDNSSFVYFIASQPNDEESDDYNPEELKNESNQDNNQGSPISEIPVTTEILRN